MPQAAITVVIAGPESVIFTEHLRAFWQTVNMFSAIFCKNVILSQINRPELPINAEYIGL